LTSCSFTDLSKKYFLKIQEIITHKMKGKALQIAMVQGKVEEKGK